jgi:hypothetical protein
MSVFLLVGLFFVHRGSQQNYLIISIEAQRHMVKAIERSTMNIRVIGIGAPKKTTHSIRPRKFAVSACSGLAHHNYYCLEKLFCAASCNRPTFPAW